MPPKKVDKGQQKAAEKAQQRVIEDKTFGLKNKNKSKSVQKFIKSVQTQVTGGKCKTEEQLRAEQHEQKEAKKANLQQQALLASIFKGSESMKKLNLDQGGKKVDPKTIRMEQQIDVYTDQRQQKKSNEETMDDWDRAKLEQVIKTKHGAHKATTDIVCKFFLDALEKRLYGWFWQCPNGETCQYKHCLPPGYVLKPREIPDNADEDGDPIEVLIEKERAALPAGGTPVTLETFKIWKEKKLEEARRAMDDLKQKASKEGRIDMSGRDLFACNPNLFIDDEGAVDDEAYLDRSESEQEGESEQEDRDNEGSASNDDATKNIDAPPGDGKDDVYIGRVDVFLNEPEVIDSDDLDDE